MNGTQLWALLWLRWRLTRNQWRRSGELNAVITLVAVMIGLGLALVGGVAGIALGALLLSHASPQSMTASWDVLVALFLFFWIIGLVTELQRSEMLDLSRLLHLPVSLPGVFLLNYLASHLSMSLAAVLPAMLGLTAGLVVGRGLAMLLLVPLVFGFFFMITAWTYCLRGWLATLMVNKRRRRAIIMGITMAIVLAAQLPNLVTNVWLRDRHGERAQGPPTVEQPGERHVPQRGRMTALLGLAHRYVPLLWLPQGAEALAEGRVWPAVFGALGMSGIGALGLARAYRTTLRFYQGGGSGKRAAVAPAEPSRRTGRKILVQWRLPAVPEEAAALALATFRSMSRAPEVKMALATNVVIFAVLGTGMLLRRTAALPAEFLPFVADSAVAVAFLGLAQMIFNQFGFDRAGFRALVLLPVPRHRILLGKNLAFLPVALLVFGVYLALVTVLAHLRVWDVLSAVVEFMGALLALSALGNLISILVPYHIAPGSLKPTKTTGTTQLLVFVANLLVPVALLPVFVPAALGFLGSQFAGLSATAITLGCAVLLTAASALLYWQTLKPLGRLLERRERAILEVVTKEVE